jgi:type I restriction enzyme, S subunit
MSEQASSIAFEELISQGVLEIGDGYRAKLEELGGDGPIFLRAGLLSERGLDWDSGDRFRAELVSKLRSKLGYPGDTLVTTKGNSVGRTGFVPEGSPSFVYSPHLSYWRSLDAHRLFSRFLYYWSRSSEFATQLQAMAYSTDMAPYLSLTDQRRLKITLPDVVTQRATAQVLGALDDKIAVNERIATSCIELALAFGWQVVESASGSEVSMSDYALITKGASYRSADLTGDEDVLISLKCIGRDGLFQPDGAKPYSGQFKPEQAVNEGDIVVAQTDLTQRAEVIGKPARVVNLGGWVRMIASLDLAIVRPAHGLTGEVIMALLSSRKFHEHAQSHCNGTTVLHMSARALPTFRFNKPSNETIARVTGTMRPLFVRSDQARRESQLLGQLRDTLLSNLMSGEIRARDAERIVEGAT